MENAFLFWEILLKKSISCLIYISVLNVKFHIISIWSQKTAIISPMNGVGIWNRLKQNLKDYRIITTSQKQRLLVVFIHPFSIYYRYPKMYNIKEELLSPWRFVFIYSLKLLHWLVILSATYRFVWFDSSLNGNVENFGWVIESWNRVDLPTETCFVS